jgi:two-component system, OmpR family, lantibiotic biosynthesis sensor histidine kinase NisK/SpaK
MIGRLSLRGQFGATFLLILVLSAVLAAVTYGAAWLWWTGAGENVLLPANYYEKKLPPLYDYLAAQGARMLDPSAREAWETQLPGGQGGQGNADAGGGEGGVRYQVLDAAGHVRYGTIAEPVAANAADLVRKLNKQQVEGQTLTGHTVTNMVPLLDEEGVLKGAVALRYELKPSVPDPNKRLWLPVLFILVLASPFLYVLLFTVLFARGFGRRIGRPITELIQASQRIREQDLDFQLTYQGRNELGDLTRAFEEMRAELKDSLLREWRLEQERQEMVAAIAHDLRTPLTIIQGHVDGLLEGGMKNPDRLQRYLQTIAQNTRRVGHLITEMNTVSEIDKPDFVLGLRVVDVAAFFAERAETDRWLAEEQGRFLRTEVEDVRAEKRTMRLDDGRVAQIVDNLLANAIRFTPSGGEIEWKVRIEENAVHFSICDSGPGFAEKDLPYLFQKFYQGDPARTGRGHAGLGLYIAKELAEKHGGEIAAENRVEGGACVRVIIREL